MRKWTVRRSAASCTTKRGNFQPFLVMLLAACLIGVHTYSRRDREPQRPVAGRARIVDGDTIEIAGTRIRLQGIDAPEWEQTCTDSRNRSWSCGRSAADELRAHIRGQELTCDRKGYDRYKRALAVCHLPDGSDINAWMVRQGLALAYGFSGIYTSEETDAQAARRGIWSGSFVPPAQWRERQHRWRPW
jgi:endonuclease YncB( thermonuclease family)